MSAPIALLSLDYPPEYGGVARYLGNLVETAQGDMDVFVNRTHPTTGPGKVEAIELLKPGRLPWWPMVPFCKSLKRRGYQHLFVSHVIPVGTAALLARSSGGIPYSVLLHGLDLRLASSHWRKRKLTKYVLQGAKNVFVNSQFVADEVRAFDEEIKPIIITPAIQPATFPTKAEARAKLGLKSDDWIVLAVTRLVPRKGLDTLIHLLPQLPPSTRLVLVGAGHDLPRLQALANGAGDRLRFVTQATDEDRNTWYAAADCFAMPVREEGVDVEGFGIVYLEAAQAGLPVVVGRSGGAPETIIDGETGFVVDSTDPQDIVRRLTWLHAHPDEAKQMGERGRARVDREFRWSTRWQTIRRHLLP